jgi:hypothetical protein
MAIILREDNKELNKEKYHLSKNGMKNLNAAITKMEAMGLQKHDGYKMLKHLQDDEYNPVKKKDGKLVKDSNIHTNSDKIEKPQQGIENKTVEGGIHRNKVSNDKITHAFTDWLYGNNGELTIQHNAKQNLDAHKADVPKPKVQKPQKPHKEEKPLKVANGEIHTLNEMFNSNDNLFSIEANPQGMWKGFEDYMYEYDARYVLECFKDGTNPWLPLINPYEYQKALEYFTKGLELPPILQKKVYQWFGIIVKNTLVLNACTEICGHETALPSEEILDALLGDSNDEEMLQKYADENGIDNDVNDICYDLLEKSGFFDWEYCTISDYGRQPLFNVISYYNDNMSPEETLVIVNKALDAYHHQGDLSQLFIQGGTSSLFQITNSTLHEQIISKKEITNLCNEIISKNTKKLFIK